MIMILSLWVVDGTTVHNFDIYGPFGRDSAELHLTTSCFVSEAFWYRSKRHDRRRACALCQRSALYKAMWEFDSQGVIHQIRLGNLSICRSAPWSQPLEMERTSGVHDWPKSSDQGFQLYSGNEYSDLLNVLCHSLSWHSCRWATARIQRPQCDKSWSFVLSPL